MADFDQDEPEIVDEDRVVSLLTRFNDAFRHVVPRVMEEFGQEKADEFINGLRDKIERQVLNHVPLNPGYAAMKREQGLDPRILIATHQYLDSFVAERNDEAAAGTIEFRCGVARGIHQPSGLTYAQLARKHEFGDGQVPPRPHWRPQAAEFRVMGHQMARDLRSRIAQAIREEME